MNREDNRNALEIGGVPFYETPEEIEGSPYWVDLWASVNGYRIGFQVKPRTYRSASVAVYAGKALAGQRRGHAAFKERFGGKVFTGDLTGGRTDEKTEAKVAEEADRLRKLPLGNHSGL